MKRVMNYKKALLSGILLGGVIVSGSSQGLTSAGNPGIITRLNVGDKVPNLLIKNVINTKTSTVNLSAYKGKLLLLDFWETSCLSCMKALPKIEKLQKIFSDKMEVITVTRYGTKEEVTATLNRFNILKNFSLPTVIEDDKLYKYFPFKIVSHVVWIGEDGVVKAITGTEHITEEYIQQVLEGKSLNWPVKNDIVDFDYAEPLLNFTNTNISRPEGVYSSTFTGAIEGIDGTSRTRIDTAGKTMTINRFNWPLIDLCKGAITGETTGDYSLKDVILEVKDSGRFKWEQNTNGYYWIKGGISKDLYCYSVSLPADLSADAVKGFIRDDLSRWLKIVHGILVKKEDRTIPCLKLVRASKNDNLLSDNSSEEKMNLSGNEKIFENSPVKSIVGYLNDDMFKFPFIVDETGLPSDKTIDLKITGVNNVEELRQALSRYGLALVEGSTKRNMFVITEVNHKK